jgi:hypothetical protein
MSPIQCDGFKRHQDNVEWSACFQEIVVSTNNRGIILKLGDPRPVTMVCNFGKGWASASFALLPPKY